jgi:amino acid adenylation domain-containing protein
LHQLLAASAARRPYHSALVEPDRGDVTYAELHEISDRLRDRLVKIGVRRGDRVGIYLRKSRDSVAAVCGVLKAGAAYVPIDVTAPLSRNASILADCTVRAVIIEPDYYARLQSEIGDVTSTLPAIALEPGHGTLSLRAALERLQAGDPAAPAATASSAPDDLACLLYTSGSTGKPKGVMISHRNAAAFIDWCTTRFGPREDDRFASHAPFHFDLSVLDIFVSLKHGATLVLIGESQGKEPTGLARLIADQRISVWYSAPSILSLLAQFGSLEAYDYSALRLVLFAGEVFPIKHLRALKAHWPRPAYYNLYGPTETNVCTSYEVPAEIPRTQTTPCPIGAACAHLEARVADDQGRPAARGEAGELWIAGDNVAQGYWNLPEQTASVFVHDAEGRRWYRTGDIVVDPGDGCFTFLGRRDRMVKKRGYRIELGEIETALFRHPAIKEAAVLARSTDEGVEIRAFLACHGERPSIIALKRFCVAHLPPYMIPDTFRFHDSLPKTSTSKVDYQRLGCE